MGERAKPLGLPVPEGFVRPRDEYGPTTEITVTAGQYAAGAEVVPGYAIVRRDSGQQLAVFGLAQGGATPEEAVFWAERAASKNDLRFVRPPGWGDVVGALPDSA